MKEYLIASKPSAKESVRSGIQSRIPSLQKVKKGRCRHKCVGCKPKEIISINNPQLYYNAFTPVENDHQKSSPLISKNLQSCLDSVTGDLDMGNAF